MTRDKAFEMMARDTTRLAERAEDAGLHNATRLLERARAALALGCGSHLKDCDCEACTTLEAIVDWLGATHG